MHIYLFVIFVCFSKETDLKKSMLVSESYCRIAIVLFIYVSYTNKICLYQQSPPWQDLPTRTLGLGVRNGDSTWWSQQSPPWQDIPTRTLGLGVRNGDSTWWSQQSPPWQDIPTITFGLGVRNGDSTWWSSSILGIKAKLFPWYIAFVRCCFSDSHSSFFFSKSLCNLLSLSISSFYK